jgi:hypothetical protein
MATITEYFEQAQLSEAAYSEGLTSGWVGGGTEQNPSPYAFNIRRNVQNPSHRLRQQNSEIV